MELCDSPSDFPIPIFLNMLLFSTSFVLQDDAREHKIAHWYNLQPDVTFNGLFVCVWGHFYLYACAHGCENSHIYLDKVFHVGIWNWGILERTNLCLSQFLDTYIINLFHFATDCCCILNHCVELYYICTSSVSKTKCAWLPNGVLQSQEREAEVLFIKLHKPVAHTEHSRERQKKNQR